MDTPIADFVKKYKDSDTSRLHMPGHKGRGMLGAEALDITEIKGADALYEASGIIEKSEANATALFGTQRTLYSTEGSSQCIRAMLFLAIQQFLSTRAAKKEKKYPQACEEGKPIILAARNVHKSFLYAGAMLDFQVEWLYSRKADSICSCIISPDLLEDRLSGMEVIPAAVYITSPDYLGGMQDYAALARICHSHGTYLLVDNAHGAYTHFLQKSLHPMDMGADMCCDSAHKTLPVLTGGAYLHIGPDAPAGFAENAKQALALFGSTSPSYLILQSLDLCNAYLAEGKDGAISGAGYTEKLSALADRLDAIRLSLKERGWDVADSDPLKLVIRCNGLLLAERLRSCNIECEYADGDYLVLMLTPDNTSRDFDRLNQALLTERADKYSAAAFVNDPLPLSVNVPVLSLRQAFFAPHETIPVDRAVGRICAAPLVSCPPAIPVVISGERISPEALPVFRRYGIDLVDVTIE